MIATRSNPCDSTPLAPVNEAFLRDLADNWISQLKSTCDRQYAEIVLSYDTVEKTGLSLSQLLVHIHQILGKEYSLSPQINEYGGYEGTNKYVMLNLKKASSE